MHFHMQLKQGACLCAAVHHITPKGTKAPPAAAMPSKITSSQADRSQSHIPQKPIPNMALFVQLNYSKAQQHTCFVQSCHKCC